MKFSNKFDAKTNVICLRPFRIGCRLILLFSCFINREDTQREVDDYEGEVTSYCRKNNSVVVGESRIFKA